MVNVIQNVRCSGFSRCKYHQASRKVQKVGVSLLLSVTVPVGAFVLLGAFTLKDDSLLYFNLDFPFGMGVCSF
jgi:hypothetical protein